MPKGDNHLPNFTELAPHFYAHNKKIFMKNEHKSPSQAKPQTGPSNQKREQATRKDEGPRQKNEQSIDKEIEKRTQENRTPKGENL